MKRIIRKLFYIPILPLIIIHYIALPLHWVTEKTLDFIHEIMDQYGIAVRNKFSWLMNQERCTMYDQDKCDGFSSKTGCNYADISNEITICPNDLKDGGKVEK